MRVRLASSLLIMLLFTGLGLFAGIFGESVQAQSCSGTVECGDWEGGIYLCPDNSECLLGMGCPSGGLCEWVEPFCDESGITLTCSHLGSESSCNNQDDNCLICASSSCTWDPGGGGGTPTPTATPGGPSPTPWSCGDISVGSCGEGNECSSVGDCPSEPGWECKYVPGQGSVPVCFHNCCGGGSSMPGCGELCDEPNGRFCAPGFSCQPKSSLPPGTCPHNECCWRSSCPVPTATPVPVNLSAGGFVMCKHGGYLPPSGLTVGVIDSSGVTRATTTVNDSTYTYSLQWNNGTSSHFALRAALGVAAVSIPRSPANTAACPPTQI